VPMLMPCTTVIVVLFCLVTIWYWYINPNEALEENRWCSTLAIAMGCS